MNRTRSRPTPRGLIFRLGTAAFKKTTTLLILTLAVSACALPDLETAEPAPSYAPHGLDKVHPAALVQPLLRDAGSVQLHARIETPVKPQQCVPYARQVSGIQIRGDARTWWRQAEGRYRRDNTPAVGAVLALKPRGASRGHVAVVTDILNPREIVVEHANWLNRGRIHKNTPVIDISPNNDWSAVRVWHVPGQRYGAGVYRAYGFIHPGTVTASR
jgi:hypothetical protein